MTISGVSWRSGYSRVGEGEWEEGGVPPRWLAKGSSCGVLSILSARVRGVLVGEDIVVERMMMGMDWVVMC